jgi:carbonic anhydrase
MNNKSITITLLILALVLGAVGILTKPKNTIKSNSSTSLAKKKSTSHSNDPLAFDYDGEKGPDSWSKLSDQYKECSQKVQTPIDIKKGESILAQLPVINYNYPAQIYKVKDNGHTIVYTPSLPSNIDIGGKKSQLVQFHYHIPSEHDVDSKEYNMEIHFVHEDEDCKTWHTKPRISKTIRSNPGRGKPRSGDKTSYRY